MKPANMAHACTHKVHRWPVPLGKQGRQGCAGPLWHALAARSLMRCVQLLTACVLLPDQANEEVHLKLSTITEYDDVLKALTVRNEFMSKSNAQVWQGTHHSPLPTHHDQQSSLPIMHCSTLQQSCMRALCLARQRKSCPRIPSA